MGQRFTHSLTVHGTWYTETVKALDSKKNLPLTYLVVYLCRYQIMRFSSRFLSPQVKFSLDSKSTSGFYAVKELNTSRSVENARIIIIKPEGGDAGAVCPDHFTTMDAIVACKQTGAGIGGRIVEVSWRSYVFRAKLIVVQGSSKSHKINRLM